MKISWRHVIYSKLLNNSSSDLNNPSGRIIIYGTIFGAIYGRIYCTIYGTINLTIHHYEFHNSGAGAFGTPPIVVESIMVAGEVDGSIFCIEFVLPYMAPKMVPEIMCLPRGYR